MCFPFGKRVWLEKITCNWGISLKEGKMKSLLPCFPEDPSTPHCSRPTSPRAAWSPPSAPRPPRSTCRAECRCTPQPPASSRGDTRTRCIFRPIILWSCYQFSNTWWCYFFVLGKGKESVWVSRSRRDWGDSCCLRPLIKANKAQSLIILEVNGTLVNAGM